VDEGQPVGAGQLLFTVDVTNLKQEDQIARAAIARARADLESAQLELRGTELLFNKRVVSETELDLAKAKALSARAAVEQARATRAAINLEYAKISAPFAGVINRIPYRMGSPVDDGKVLTTLTDAEEIYAYFRLSEAEYLTYAAPGAEFPKQVWLRLADGSSYPSPGVVDALETEFNRDTGSIAMRARFSNPDGILKQGSTGTVIVKEQLQAALTVPQKSTFEVQEQLYVYVVDPSNTARARRIVPRLRLADSFVVASGLDKSDRFVLEGVQKLKDGMTVDTLPAAATTGS
jgi:membrane fusion protein (multidrug efflux system)